MNIRIPQNLSYEEIEMFINKHLESQKCKIVGIKDETGTVYLSTKASKHLYKVKVMKASSDNKEEKNVRFKYIYMAPMPYQILQEQLSAST